MARFKVQWDYRSNYASYTEGSEVDVEDDLAALVNRDSPGVLEPVDKPKKSKGTVDEVLAAVGDDLAAAQKALDTELAAGSPRSTLVDALESIIDGT